MINEVIQGVSAANDMIAGWFGASQADKNREAQEKQQKIDNAFRERQYANMLEQQAYAKEVQQKTWERDDNATQRRAADMEKAGLSKVLAAGSAAGNTISPQQGGSVGGGGQAPTEVPADHWAKMNDVARAYMDLTMQRKAIEKTNAEIYVLEAQAAKIDRDVATQSLETDFDYFQDPNNPDKNRKSQEYALQRQLDKMTAEEKRALVSKQWQDYNWNRDTRSTQREIVKQDNERRELQKKIENEQLRNDYQRMENENYLFNRNMGAAMDLLKGATSAYSAGKR